MQVGTTINLCDQRPADSRAAKWRWNPAPKLKLATIIIIITIIVRVNVEQTYRWLISVFADETTKVVERKRCVLGRFDNVLR